SEATARRGARARHTGLGGTAQGAVSPGIFVGAEDTRGRPCRARRDEKFLAGRHGPHAVPAAGLLQELRRLRRRRQARYLEFDSRRARLGWKATGRQGLAARYALGA